MTCLAFLLQPVGVTGQGGGPGDTTHGGGDGDSDGADGVDMDSSDGVDGVDTDSSDGGSGMVVAWGRSREDSKRREKTGCCIKS